MILLVSILTQLAAASPTLAEALALPADVAGDRVLQDLDHGVVESVGRNTDIRLAPPGVVEVHLVERPALGRESCVRRRWTVWFRAEPGDHGHVANIREGSDKEIALTSSGSCPRDGYAHINPGLDQAQAIAALTALEGIRSGRSGLTLSCRDETASGLCEDDQSVRSELVRLPAWAVTREGEAVLIWLGGGGFAVTEVRLDPHTPDRAEVSRRTPAPA